MKTRRYLDSDYGGGQGEDDHHGEDHVETVQHLLGDIHTSDLSQLWFNNLYLMLFLFLHIELLTGAQSPHRSETRLVHSHWSRSVGAVL